MLAQVGLGREAPAPVPARAVRRHAAAGDDRRGAADRPRLLLADEPTTALDVTTQAEVMAILAELRRDFGLALLFITHDLELAAAVCDRTAVMYAGQVVEIRDSALLHDDPLHPYTAALAAARPDIGRSQARLRAIPAGRCPGSRRREAACAFAPRCAHAAPAAEEELPLLTELDGGLSRCLRAGELRGTLGVTPMPDVLDRGEPAQGVRRPGRGGRRVLRRRGAASRWRSSGSRGRARPRSPG